MAFNRPCWRHPIKEAYHDAIAPEDDRRSEAQERSPRTIETYVSMVARFAKFHGRSPELLGPEAVREYQKHLLDSGTSWAAFNQTVCALKFLYRVTLRAPWPVEQIPYGRKPRKLPVVLSQDEVIRLIGAVDHPVYRMALLTAYAAGLRITETGRAEDRAHRQRAHDAARRAGQGPEAADGAALGGVAGRAARVLAERPAACEGQPVASPLTRIDPGLLTKTDPPLS